MKMKITEVQEFFDIGCGRCDKGNTPECKVHAWSEELQLLRGIVLSCKLKEELKWSQPCYSYNGTNVVLVSAFKNHCVLSFFRGSLLSDPENILEKPGENSNVGRVVRFTNIESIREYEHILKQYIFEAVELVKQGKKVDKPKTTQDVPIELTALLDSDTALKEAFEALTPGRQRSYYLHVSSAKQSKTRTSRAEKCAPKIFEGIGFNEYKN
jgi:uncharacterized protein YdeI (YjbR/CyaY-like superfamily)